MKIAVCVKQVPFRNEGGMDSETGLILRGKLKTVINTYDLSAIETGLKMREKLEDSFVDVFTMAPERGADVIVQAYSMGVDHGYLLCDKRFGGADVLATAYTLSMGISYAGNYDLIICGKQTTDGDTGQVGSAIASCLDLPYVSGVSEIIRIDQKTAVFKQILDHEEYIIESPYPCVISVLKEIFIPRLPVLSLKLKAKKREITILDADRIKDCDINQTGTKGSPTRVVKIYPSPNTVKEKLIIQEAKASSALILDIIKEAENVR
jgi:electron transfer flavoprotein beta subunit